MCASWILYRNKIMDYTKVEEKLCMRTEKIMDGKGEKEDDG